MEVDDLKIPELEISLEMLQLAHSSMAMPTAGVTSAKLEHIERPVKNLDFEENEGVN